MTLTDAEILDRKAALEAAVQDRASSTAATQQAAASSYQYVRPFSSSLDGVIEALTNPEGRIMLGLFDVDALTRGFGAKELVMILGFSHAGKTQLANTLIKNNADRRILFFSMDDPAEMILVKLACMLEGISADELERRVKAGDQQATQALRACATDRFRNLIVVDDSLGLTAMDKAVAEATAYWGAPPEAVMVDYLGSMQGNGHTDDGEDGGIKTKAAALKRWVKDKPFPTIVLHQNTRSRGAPGEPITMMSGAFGGEQEATIIVGVRRKKDWADLDEFARTRHEHTVTLHVVKNKRPPGRLTPRDGVDFHLDRESGVIRPLTDADFPMHLSAPSVAVRTVQQGAS